MTDPITSRSNPLVKYAASLQTKKGREEAGAFPVEGEKLFLEAVRAGVAIERIFVSEARRDALFGMISDALSVSAEEDPRVTLLSESAYSKISSENAPQGILTVIKSLDIFKKCIKIDKKEFLSFKDGRLLALASVRDPGNLGAILRSAAAFGFSGILLSDDCVELTNPKTARAAMGALFRMKLTVVEDMVSTLREAKAAGRKVYAAELREGARSVLETELSSSDIIVIGNEGHGIPHEISSAATASLYIPIAKGTESLNAAVAASIFLWEIGRKE